MQVHFKPADQNCMTDVRIAKISLGGFEGGVGVSCDNWRDFRIPAWRWKHGVWAFHVRDSRCRMPVHIVAGYNEVIRPVCRWWL